ncbi:hypothetical protein C8P64_0927 [Christiangramia gaetbulicola]|uniref:Uncharacterized protein n=1 Tax=Christiangramia gaetbulicola TaxID=703340 RepID=A0A2T6AM94_9FLAO|nr:DUF5996 family protein [Christiangramia gaetbulicola]PTX44941.1 hypothetical protein C8P64_0927 [Christiangramia gaetbulicola]
MENINVLPELKYVGNEKKKLTLHLFFQILGKVRMCFMPRKNHWWYITLYVNEKGFTTGPIPIEDGFESFSLTLNILENKLDIFKSTGEIRSFRLEKGLSVSDFYNYLLSTLKELDINVKINGKPFDLNIDKRFSEITEYHHYNKEYVTAYWKIFLWVSSVFKEFSGRFYGKTCPVHLYWHSMDLAVTRFSGKKAPAMPAEARTSDKDAYSHECISFGFWAGDDNVQEPAFYSYTFPAPENLDNQPLEPGNANWIMNNGSPMAVLTYADLKEKDNPRKILLEFLESAYQAGASLAGWDIENFKVPPLKEL